MDHRQLNKGKEVLYMHAYSEAQLSSPALSSLKLFC